MFKNKQSFCFHCPRATYKLTLETFSLLLPLNRHDKTNNVSIKFLELSIKACQHFADWPTTQCFHSCLIYEIVWYERLSKDFIMRWYLEIYETVSSEKIILVSEKKSKQLSLCKLAVFLALWNRAILHTTISI